MFYTYLHRKKKTRESLHVFKRNLYIFEYICIENDRKLSEKQDNAKGPGTVMGNKTAANNISQVKRFPFFKCK